MNRWIVSKYEELALIDPDVVTEPEAGSTDPCPEAEPPNRLLPAPEAPETKDSGPPEDERSFLQNRRKQRIGRKSIRLPPIPWLEKNLCPKSVGIMEKRKNKASNGEKVWLRTGRLTPATFTEAAETLTGSGSTRNPEKD